MATGRHHVGDGSRLGQEHVLHDDEALGKGEGIDVVARDGIRADDVQRLQLAFLGSVHHLQQVQAGSGGNLVQPLLVEARRAGHGSVARQHVGIEPHVGCTAGIGVIAQADELRALRKAEVDQSLDVAAAQLGTEDDDQAGFSFHRVAQFGQSFASELLGDNRVGCAVVAGEELHQAAFGTGRDLRKRRSLPVQLDGRRIRHVQLGAMQPNIAADLPRQQGMLLGGIVADQQDRRRAQTSRIEAVVFCLPASAEAKAG